MAELRQVVITGLGVVSPLGDSAGELFERLVAGEGAIRAHADLAEYPVPLAARVPGDPDGAELSRRAAAQALAQAGLSRVEEARIGTTLGESGVFESRAPEVPSPEECNGFSWLQALPVDRGLILPTACVAGSQAIGGAAAAIAEGRLERALAGGVEPFSRIAQVGFGRLRAMDPRGCRPFSPSAAGMTPGAGAALLVLESEESARARGARILAYVQGFGLSCDAEHPTRPSADGAGLSRAIRLATHARPDWICGHGSGTPGSDPAELAAYRALWGAELPPLSGLKGAIGHALGAASALTAAVAVEALLRGEASPTLGDGPTLQRRTPLPRPGVVLIAAMAFGGQNAALVLGAEPAALPRTRRVRGPDWRDARDLSAELRRLRGATPPERLGLHAAVRGAGNAEATALWTDALTHGPKFANPRIFPQTLPSYTATTLACAAEARGPNATYAGGPEAMLADARALVARGQADAILLYDLTRTPARIGRLEADDVDPHPAGL